jgi:serine/threonine protein kinase
VAHPSWVTSSLNGRFAEEARILSVLDHPNIVRILRPGHVQSHNGSLYFAMELLSDFAITRFCDTHRLGLDRRLAFFRQVCRAVEHVHRHGVIHCDIKPGNILMSSAGSDSIPKLIDFGIAMRLTDGMSMGRSPLQPDDPVGTPAYMSPEQTAGGLRGLDQRVDVYSLGVLLTELIVGRRPPPASWWTTGNRLEETGARTSSRLRSPSALLDSLDACSLAKAAWCRSTTPKALRAIMTGRLGKVARRALAADRDARYPNVAALAVDLDDLP